MENGSQALSTARDALPEGREALWLAALPVGLGAMMGLRRARRVPIQRSIDVAVPIELAYQEWMKLEFLPEGSRRVSKIERSGNDALTGRVTGLVGSRKWEAEVRDERDCDSFAWRSVKGSDVAGLITFHRLGERLTRLELQLDTVPVRPLEAIEFVIRLADARAQADLRRFKARVETISPDVYPEPDDTNEGSDDH